MTTYTVNLQNTYTLVKKPISMEKNIIKIKLIFDSTKYIRNLPIPLLKEAQTWDDLQSVSSSIHADLLHQSQCKRHPF